MKVVYTNILGLPEAKATISVFGGVFHPNKYSMTTLIEGYPSKSWTIDTSIDAIISEMERDGFSCTARKDGYNNPVIDCVHIDTQAVIDAAKAEQDEQFSGAERGYIRFGELPEGGRSKNFRDDVLEAGVSCFDAEIAVDGSYRLLLTPVLQVSYLTVMGRNAYRLYGERIGTGADGEPILRVERSEVIK